MIEKIYLLLILVFFILAFAIRNIKTYLATKMSIKGKSVKLTLSVLISTVIYGIIIARLTFLKPVWLLEISLPAYAVIKLAGLAMVTVGFILGILALIQMRNSWRVGIKYDQKTNLVTNGIYKVSRNPYFLSYNILISGYTLIFPSLALVVLYVTLVIVFHRMILEEEKYLESVHGKSYLDYKNKVNRYI